MKISSLTRKKKTNPLPSLRGGPKGRRSNLRTEIASALSGILPRNDRYGALIENALRRALPSEKSRPAEVHQAMRYAVLNGGKRFRPALVLSACEAVGGDPRRALLPACAVEMIHAYSLVHDDLPALDDDDLRRGKPTCHKKFGEALAILTGDALLTLAFEILSEVKPPGIASQLTRELAGAAGTQGMIGGQVVDILLTKNGSGHELDLADLDYISRNKTGRLIQASTVLGAVVGTRSRAKIRKIRRFGAALGLAFQVADDIMDRDGYLQLMSLSDARKKVGSLIQSAKQEAASFGKKGARLLELADFLLGSIQ